MSQTTAELLAELRSPHNDFPVYYTELCARAADAIDGMRGSPPLGAYRPPSGLFFTSGKIYCVRIKVSGRDMGVFDFPSKEDAESCINSIRAQHQSTVTHVVEYESDAHGPKPIQSP